MYATSTSSFSPVRQYETNVQTKPSMTTVVAVAASLLLVGTGASYPVNTFKQWRHYVQPKVPFVFDTADSAFTPVTDTVVDVRSIAQHLANIREVLSPSMSDLAKDLGITRQALYKWLSGENQPDDLLKTQYIITLSNIADKFAAENITDAKLLIKMKAFNGLSLIDLIKRGEDWQQPVSVLIDEAKTMNAAAENANFVASKAMPTNDWLASISIPATTER